MIDIIKKYIVDENNKNIAVEIDIDTFNKIEEIIENYGLYQLMRETDNDTSMTIKDAKDYYNGLSKND